MMPTSIGARLRYTIDRDSELYKQIYRQRTAVERINSQAVASALFPPFAQWRGHRQSEHPHLSLINLRFLQRLRQNQRNPLVDQSTVLARNVASH
jgi:hypothetical protein